MLPRVRQALARPPKRTPRSADEATQEAAVAAVFYGLDPRDPQLLFIQRATVEGDPWSGHVAFPGGRREDEDATLLDTAVRETWEELGLDLSPADYLGVLDEIGPVSRRKPLVVQPHVFHLPELPSLTPNREVAAVHRLSLAELLANEGRGPMPFEWDGQAMELARVDFSDVRLWGMTLRIVDDLLHRLDGSGTGLTRIGGTSPF
jgi:8-oxo-dGTP pyrophosphatase MutT (NUDIX family)